MAQSVEETIQEIIDRETRAWDLQDVDLLLSILHPDMVWPWPSHARAHDPVEWQLVLGRFDRERWRRGWGDLFDTHDLVHNRRGTVMISVSKEGDGAFAVVDVDTLWRNKVSGIEDHWLGRACKIYTLVDEGWKMIAQTGLLDYSLPDPRHETWEEVTEPDSIEALASTSVASLSQAREAVKRKIVEAARRDPRIVGCLDFGSTGQGKGDQYSDLDLALFVRDDELESLSSSWKEWAGQFGRVLMAFYGADDHPWLIYDVSPVPLRVDLIFYAASAAAKIAQWPASPETVDSILLYDGTEGRITREASRLVGKSLAPSSEKATFEKISGALWYYLIRTWGKLQRGQLWAARREFHMIILGNLFALLRLEAGAIERWLASESSDGIEEALTPQQLDQLETCIPGPGESGLRSALLQSALISREVQERLAARNDWSWPKELATRVITLLSYSIDG